MKKKSNNPKDVLTEVMLLLDRGKPSYALEELKRFKKTVERTAYERGRLAKTPEVCDFCGEILEDYNNSSK